MYTNEPGPNDLAYPGPTDFAALSSTGVPQGSVGAPPL